MKDESCPSTEALVVSLQDTEAAASGSRLARLKRRGLRVVVWLRRHPWLVATFGFVSGVSSFFLVERHEGVARAMAVAMLAGLFKAHRENPAITIPEFLRQHSEVHYTVLVPKPGELAILRRYPWLGRDLEKVPDPKAWEFSFAATGVPLEIRPVGQAISAPVVTYVKPTQGNHADFTVDRLTGTGSTATLTPAGSRYLQLISDSF